MANVSFKVQRDDISPHLAKLAATARRPEKVFRAMGTTFLSLTMGTFNDVGAEYRPVAWAKKKDGTPSKLQKSGTLSRSFHLDVTSSSATVGSPVIYAATHQFGRGPIPARPFFPVVDGKLTPKAEEKIRRAGERALERQIGSEG